MMKHLFTLLLPACLLPSGLQAQPSVLVEYQVSANEAKTLRVPLYAIRRNEERSLDYGVVKLEGEISSEPMPRIAFVERPDGWTQARLRMVAGATYRNGWQIEHRRLVRRVGQSLLSKMESEGALLADPLLKSYLDELLLRLHPLPMGNHHPEAECHLQAAVLAGETAVQGALPDGTLLIPLRELALLQQEKDLARWLSRLILFAEADLPFTRYNTYADPMTSAFSLSGATIAQFDRSVKTWVQPQLDSMAWADSAAFTRRLAPALQYAGWQEYARHNYQAALRLCDRLIMHEAASAETFLLKALVYKQLYATPAAIQTAYSYLVRAESLSELPRAEILTEKSLLLIRMGKLEEAAGVLGSYREMMAQEQNARELIWAEDLIRYCRAEAGRSAPAPAGKSEKAPE